VDNGVERADPPAADDRDVEAGSPLRIVRRLESSDAAAILLQRIRLGLLAAFVLFAGIEWSGWASPRGPQAVFGSLWDVCCLQVGL
jgi:hypothetical protein